MFSAHVHLAGYLYLPNLSKANTIIIITMPIELVAPIWLSSSTAAWLATFASAIVIFTLFGRRKYNLPPGPKPWPIIGNLNLIGPLPHRSIHALSQKHGHLMGLKFGSKTVVVASSVEMAKTFLKTHDASVSGRARFAVGKYITYNYSNITWSPYGGHWRQARKIFLIELFCAKRLASYNYIRREELKILLKELYDSAGQTILLNEHVSSLSLNVVSRMALGKKYVEKNKNDIVSPEEFKKMMDELFLLSGVLNIGDFIPWINFLDLQGYIRRMKAVGKKFDRFMEHVLDEHMERRKEIQDYVAKDMVDVLLQLADDPSLEFKLERHRVKALTLDLIAGGTETSTVTVEWAFSELLKNPDKLDKATEELDRVIGRERWVEEQDIVNLPYIDAITKETMRLHPVVPMLVPRQALEDLKIGAYHIPKGTQVLINVWAIGRDPSIWDNPNEFQPERFIGKDIDVRGHDYKLLPFGAGRRMCPGYPLGLKVIQASVANLLHGFYWRLPPNMTKEDLNMEEIFGLTIPKKFPLEAIVEPRLSSHLYAI